MRQPVPPCTGGCVERLSITTRHATRRPRFAGMHQSAFPATDQRAIKLFDQHATTRMDGWMDGWIDRWTRPARPTTHFGAFCSLAGRPWCVAPQCKRRLVPQRRSPRKRERHAPYSISARCCTINDLSSGPKSGQCTPTDNHPIREEEPVDRSEENASISDGRRLKLFGASEPQFFRLSRSFLPVPLRRDSP